MFGFAAWTLAHMPATTLHGPLAADAAKLVASVPIDLGSTLRQNAGFDGSQLCSRGPRFFEAPGLIQVQFMLRVTELRNIDGEVRHAVLLAEKHRWDIDPQALNVARAQPAKAGLGLAMQQHVELPQRQETATRVLRLRLEPLLIPALDVTTVKRITSKYV
jgi:hypothetical protein